MDHRGLMPVAGALYDHCRGHAFISYSRRDKVYVEKLAAHLASAGANVWYDYEIATGERWSRVIERQIETCDAMIVVMSPASRESDMVGSEIDFARSRGKPFLPLLLAGEPFLELRTIQYTDVRDGSLPGPGFVRHLPRTDAHPVTGEPSPATRPQGTPAPPPLAPDANHGLAVFVSWGDNSAGQASAPSRVTDAIDVAAGE